jgi:hypothetical protein
VIFASNEDKIRRLAGFWHSGKAHFDFRIGNRADREDLGKMAAALFIDLDKKSHAQLKEEGYRRPKPLLARGHAAAAPPSSVMNARRVTRSPRRRGRTGAAGR